MRAPRLSPVRPGRLRRPLRHRPEWPAPGLYCTMECGGRTASSRSILSCSSELNGWHAMPLAVAAPGIFLLAAKRGFPSHSHLRYVLPTQFVYFLTGRSQTSCCGHWDCFVLTRTAQQRRSERSFGYLPEPHGWQGKRLPCVLLESVLILRRCV